MMMFAFAQDATLAIEKLLDLYNTQNAALNTLWNFLSIISLGILGFVYKDKESRENWRVKIGLSIGYLLFSIGNLFALRKGQEIVIALSNAIKAAATDSSLNSDVLRAHSAITVFEITLYQLIMLGVVLLAIWLPNIILWLKGEQKSNGET
jgi:hypothetical protein